MDGLRAGRCMDGESFDPQPGGPVHVFPCQKRWHQYLSFGNGKEAPVGALHTNVPLHTRRRIAETGREQEAYMCLGVPGRGDLDEEDWLGRRKTYLEESESEDSEDSERSLVDGIDLDNFSVDGDDEHREDMEIEDEGTQGPLDLWHWEDEQLVATRCSNVDAIIEWVLVPFIEEDNSTTVYENKNAEGSLKNKTSNEEDAEEL
jgi:hypothetical protein